ncbi:CotH kinase family protein [Lewinella sp. 4G2]|uniref:CotH kinase family protein n=1 Tax=Lewinella sp. 4G2 TaxID=1803372 RepID=UPI0007B49472|nr:CotH kinase family protein [Lewinella sp. 4G2]OAV43448.1 hypothetical protein A3850_002580 [Lewinella sp. 4G2]
MPSFTHPILPQIIRFLLLLFWGAAAGVVQGQATSTELITLEVTIDEDRLFNPRTGWFVEGPGVHASDWKKEGANFWTHDSHPADVKLIMATGRTIFSGKVDFRLFGGMSRLHPQKSFSLSCREAYGQEYVNYPLFGESAPDQFKYLVVRNGGSDWGRSYLRDVLLTGLLRDPSWELDIQASRPCRVYLNGRYWGLYHLREKINPHWLAERFGVSDKNNIDLLEGNSGVKHGGRRDYDQLMKFVRRNNLNDPNAFQAVRRRMDVDNFQRLQIAQIYFDNQEAGGNLRYWRDRTDPNSRYRWILYDVDQGFGLHDPTAYTRNTLDLLTAADGPAWPNPPWVTRLQRNLLENDGYRATFVNRMLDYLQTDFRPDAVLAAIDGHVAGVGPEIARQSERWGIDEKYWPIHVERLREFARQRPAFVREHFRNKFGGGPDREVTIKVGEGGTVVLNENISLADETYVGSYFSRIPITVEPIADPGFRFVRWEDGATEGKRTVDLNGAGPVRLQPRFAPAAAPVSAGSYVAPTGEGLADETSTPVSAGVSTEQTLLRLSVALVVFVLIGLYASIARKPE